MKRTSIEWTDFTTNPLKYRTPDGRVVWACVHASEGCRHCYSEAIAHHYKRGDAFTAPHMADLTPFLDEAELHKMLTYKPASGKRCFPFDMTDLFGEWVPDELIDRVFAVFALRPDVTWQVLTKRAKRMRGWMTRIRRNIPVYNEAATMIDGEWSKMPGDMAKTRSSGGAWWPLSNVWLGVSVEDQGTADERIPDLLATSASKRFISLEPQLAQVSLEAFLHCGGCGYTKKDMGIQMDHRLCKNPTGMLDGVIQGGESGPGARPFDVAWARFIREQCGAAGVAYFLKQLGAAPVGAECESCDGCLAGRRCDLLPRGKGGDMDVWPEDLRVREMPS